MAPGVLMAQGLAMPAAASSAGQFGRRTRIAGGMVRPTPAPVPCRHGLRVFSQASQEESKVETSDNVTPAENASQSSSRITNPEVRR
eukprot:scaffold74739_cov22-Prasinocladus_malaysianus.AAC.2